MFVKEGDFVFECLFDWHFVVNIFLGSVYDTDVSQFEMDLLIHKHALSGCAFIHDIDFCDDSDSPFSCLVPVSGQLKTIRGRQILVSRDNTEDDSLGIPTVVTCHLDCHFLNILLAFDIDTSDAGQVDYGQIGTII